MDITPLSIILVTPLCVAVITAIFWFALKPSPSNSAALALTHKSLDAHRKVFLFENGVLIDANLHALKYLNLANIDAVEWSAFAATLAQRFPSFPTSQGHTGQDKLHTHAALDPDDAAIAVLEEWGDICRVSLHIPADTSPAPQTEDMTANNRAVSAVPYPIWHSDHTGTIVWANVAYLSLCEKLGKPWDGADIPDIFDLKSEAPDNIAVRCAISDHTKDHCYWYDVTTVNSAQTRMHYATDANAIVNAEIAQRNFVQTLTKTFAQLSIGLAIFDRNRQLALFNPALIDLTSLQAEFLSGRPNLMAFFDRLRENRMMPEPKNYASWREHLAELVVAASDDRYSETWTLPSGVTYRVSGRPHPDGAIAFLFEDISAEISLTRRFRAELELGQSVLDALDRAVAVFSPAGSLIFCSLAYQELWRSDPETTFAEYTLRDAIQHWRQMCAETQAWGDIRQNILDLNARTPIIRHVSLTDGTPVDVRVLPLNGGATVVIFDTQTADTRTLAQPPLQLEENIAD
ncbi:diguanylate cyclase [Shimia litoralis]|uniref:Diguanylate cyclase n=1 Tax=Shimia litoralis TaxID=420403 RepID=A0A4U7N2E3_9RHOB|nr:diguanylate cyclase [Shimia litoralis]